MASNTDWARTIGTTLVNHLKEEELTTFRKFKVFAALEANGKVAMNQGGRGFDWQVRFKNQPVTSNNGESPRIFARHNLWQRANLPYRGYSVTDMVSKREMLENRGAQALIDVAGKMASRLQESMEQHLSSEVYVDGNATGNENRWHGLESLFAYDGTINVSTGAKRGTGTSPGSSSAPDPFAYPSDVYAGLNTDLGYLAGSLKPISPTPSKNSWPLVPADPEYDYYSPIICNYTSTYFAGSTGTSLAASWQGNCVEAIREAVNHAKRNDTKENQIDMILVDRALYIQFLNRLDARERAIVSKSNGLRSYGFGDVVELDGIEVSTEYAVPPGVGYGLSIGNMEMKCMEGQLMTAEGPFYNEELQSHRYAVSVLANIKMKSPRNFIKFAAIA
jgi:hypothetical protein